MLYCTDMDVGENLRAMFVGGDMYWYWGLLVVWLECRYLDTEVDGANPGISILCP